MKLFRTFAAFALALLLNACTAARPAETAPVGLFPLVVGHFWIYEIGMDDETSTVENKIAASQVIGDTEWFLSIEYGEKFWIRNSPEGQVEAVNLYTKGEDAAIFERLDPKTIHEELIFKFPAQAGDNWVTLDNVLRYEGQRIFTVPAGTFQCHYYSITQPFIDKQGQTYAHNCIAEGIGVIYSDNTLPDGTLEISRLKKWGKR